MIKKIQIYLFIFIITIYSGTLHCNDFKYEDIALIWMKASINGDEEILEKNSDWKKIITDINPEDVKAFETKKGSILEGHAFYSDVARSNEWTEGMLSTLKMTSSKMAKNVAFVKFKFMMNNKLITVKLSLNKVNGQWKVFKDE